MKKLFTFLFLLGFILKPSASEAQIGATGDIALTNVVISGTDLTFDVYLSSAVPGEILYFNNADLKIEFDNTQFTNPVFSKVARLVNFGFPLGNVDVGHSTFVSTTYTDPNDLLTSFYVHSGYHSNTSTTVITPVAPAPISVATININLIPITNQTDYDDQLAAIGFSCEMRLGRFSISGYNGADDGTLADLNWSTSNYIGEMDNNLNFTSSQATNGVTPSSISADVCSMIGVTISLELGAFSADNYNATDALVKWDTHSEEDLSHFIVQRSTDGDNWSDVTRVDAAGNSTSLQSYSTIDADVYSLGTGKATFYYRLKSVDVDGTTYLSDMDAVLFNSRLSDSEVTILPNPTQYQFVIALNKSQADLDGMVYQVTDMAGRVVAEGLVTGKQTKVNVERLAAGLYIVNIMKDGQKTFDAQRVVVARQ